MSRSKSLKAFSLVDILVYMAIVGVLISVAFVGINIAQRSSRDEERRVTVGLIRTAIDTFFRSTSAYPIEGTTLMWQTAKVTIGTNDVPLTGFKQYSNVSTDVTRTRYTYQKDRSGYVLCVKMESGDWYRSGTGGDKLVCPTD